MSGKRLFVVDTFCGANAATRMKVRFIMEVAWQAHFVTNMFIRPTAEELAKLTENLILYVSMHLKQKLTTIKNWA